MVLFLSVVYSLLAAVFSACSRDEHPGSKPVEILVSTGFGSVSGVETRGEGSIYEKDILSDKPLPLSVVRIDQTSESDASYLPYTATAVADGVGYPRDGHLTRFNTDIRMAFDDEAYYLSRAKNNMTKLIGWYPAVSEGGSVWAVDGSATATVSFTVDGETDVLMSDLVKGSKDNPFLDNNKMTFNHLLTRFRVRVYTYDAGVGELFGKIKSITLAGKKQTCVAQLPAVSAESGGTPTTTFTGNADLPLIQKDPADNTVIAYNLPVPLLSSDAENGPTVGLAGYAMVAPVASAGQVILNIETEKQGIKTVTIAASSDTAPNPDGFAAGKSYTLALEFNTKGIEFVNVTILDWEEEEVITDDVL